jgi:hypothetical protein
MRPGVWGPLMGFKVEDICAAVQAI